MSLPLLEILEALQAQQDVFVLGVFQKNVFTNRLERFGHEELFGPDALSRDFVQLKVRGRFPERRRHEMVD
jgi:hypothetical protein